MVTPSALNVLVIGASVILFSFLWRLVAAAFADRPIGQGMAAVL